jgi:hypothetical protein
MRFSGLFLLLAGIVLISLFSCATAPLTEERAGGVAVWDLDDLSPGVAGTNLGELLSGQVMEVLRGKAGYRIVERTRLLRALEELRLGSSALVDESSRLRVGRLIGAQRMVFGGYQIVGDQMRLDLRMVDVETGNVLKAAHNISRSVAVTSLIDAARKAAGEL